MAVRARRRVIAGVTIALASVAWQASAETISLFNQLYSSSPAHEPSTDSIHLFQFDGDQDAQGLFGDNLTEVDAEHVDEGGAEDLDEIAELRRERARERIEAERERLAELRLLVP